MLHCAIPGEGIPIHSWAPSDQTQRSSQHLLGHPCGRRADTGIPPQGPCGTSPCPSHSHTLTHLPQPQSSTIPFPSRTSPWCNTSSTHSRHEVPQCVSSRFLPAFDSLQQLLPPFAGTRSPRPICARLQAGCGASARGKKYNRSHTSVFMLLLGETVLTHSPSSLFFPPPAAQWEFSCCFTSHSQAKVGCCVTGALRKVN